MPSGMNYTDAAVVAPGPNTDASYVFFKALFDYMFLRFNLHVTGGLTADKHGLSQIDAAVDGNRPLITARSITGTTGFAESDMFRRMWLELVDADYVPANFAGKVVPITLLAARNNIRSGLGIGNGLGVPGTDLPNTNPNTIPWRDASGFIPHVYAGQSMEQNLELSAIATGTNNNITIPGGRLHRPGLGYQIWSTTIITLPSAHATLNRWDVIYGFVNESGVTGFAVTQGVQVALLANAVTPDPPEGTFIVALVARVAGSTATSNWNNVAGGTFAPVAGTSWVEPIHHRATGTVPSDSSMQARKLSDFGPIAATPPSKAITLMKAQWVNAGILVDFPQVTITYDAGGNYDGVHANPATPASGLARWDVISSNNLGQAIITLGATAATIGGATPPNFPVSNSRPICLIAVIGGMTAIYPYQSILNGTVPAGQGWIQDTVRFTSAGSGGGGSSTIAAASVVNGSDSSLADLFTIASGPAYISPNLQTSIQTSGASVNLIATANNEIGIGMANSAVGSGGPSTVRFRAISSIVATTAIGSGTASASGTKGYRYLVADLNAAGVSTFAITIQTTPVVSAYQAVIALLWWDGISTLVTVPDTYPISNLNSANVAWLSTMARLNGNITAFASTSVYTIPTGGGNLMSISPPIVIPPGAKIKVSMRANGTFNVTSVATGVFIGLLIGDGAGANMGLVAECGIDSSGRATAGVFDAKVDEILTTGIGGSQGLTGSVSTAIEPGPHTFSAGVFTSSTATVDLYKLKVIAEVVHQYQGA